VTINKGQNGLHALMAAERAKWVKRQIFRHFPSAFLLQNLSSEFVTADHLYEMAMNGGLKGYELRSGEWRSGRGPKQRTHNCRNQPRFHCIDRYIYGTRTPT